MATVTITGTMDMRNGVDLTPQLLRQWAKAAREVKHVYPTEIKARPPRKPRATARARPSRKPKAAT